jgi:predicted acylesterase/phospholipase RssA
VVRTELSLLDRLLEEPWLWIDGISGTSAGAMNAVVLADGYMQGSPKGARAALERFWGKVSHAVFNRVPLPASGSHHPSGPSAFRIAAISMDLRCLRDADNELDEYEVTN